MSTPFSTPEDHPHAYGSQPGAGGSGAPAAPPLRGPHPDSAFRDGSAGYWRASQDDKTLALLSHLGALLVSALVPLIVFLLKKDDSPFIREHTRQSLNLQIMLLIAGFVSSLLMMVLIGFILLPLVIVTGWVFQIIAAVKAYRGEMYRIPFVIDIIK
ncbi:DUF4870 domain-containing protein [Brevibacterium jeotgali]|uniref:DUF4870 domain-containing protein n=1 Tax=Brevibacterium jeotgali TaxID=1262550 RepID=A0A2H1L2K1_9MICO|nr:DUF4870 domain-containing protein [Brevibacterium jeotgali]TWC02997.1 hypothetical protein FB108_1706 [Brevibacterium jeotgali]SMY11020.1 hypothetical protein BJEO58_00601 [Brevibacterium jeotgali]